MKPSRTGDPPAVRIEAENECAWCGERRLPLMPRAFAVLRHLVDHAGRLVTKEELLTRVWRDAIVSDAALTTCIRDLRRALGDSSDTPRYIETVHRRGFRFIGPIAGPTTPRLGRAAADVGVERGSSAATPTLVGRDAELARLHERLPDSADSRPKAAALVGREAQLARLHAALDRAMNGQRQLVFVTGEPGIGKTALVEAFAGRGRRRGRPAHRSRAVRGAVRRRRSLLAGARGAGAIGPRGRGRTAGPGPQAACADLAGAVAGAAERRGPGGGAAPGAGGDARPDAAGAGGGPGRADPWTRPLVLLLEDLHWSDSATIDLLAMLARRREAARLLVLGTYRPADVAAAAHPLRRGEARAAAARALRRDARWSS